MRLRFTKYYSSMCLRLLATHRIHIWGFPSPSPFPLFQCWTVSMDFPLLPSLLLSPGSPLATQSYPSCIPVVCLIHSITCRSNHSQHSEKARQKEYQPSASSKEKYGHGNRLSMFLVWKQRCRVVISSHLCVCLFLQRCMHSFTLHPQLCLSLASITSGT